MAVSQCNVSIPVTIRLEWALFRHVDVVRLLIRQHRQLRVEFLQLQARDLFIQMFRQHLYTDRIFFDIAEKLDLRDDLIGERRRHHI